jgi:CRP/FNR family cyclic AMP-dependent transcriptional regulator
MGAKGNKVLTFGPELQSRPSDPFNFDQNRGMEESAEIVKEVYKPGDYIFFEGDIDFHLYIIQQGQVKIFTKSKAGKQIDIATVEEGESFGEFALLDRRPRSASAQAITECVLVKVSEKGYEELLEQLPVWASCMLKSFAQRMKNMNDKLRENVTMPQFLKRK